MHIRGDHAVLAIAGRLDVRSAADARALLHTAVDAGHGDLVVDLSGLDSWDTAGLGVIMGAHRRAERFARRLVLRGVPPRMRRLLVVTRLHRLLTLEEDAVPETPEPQDAWDQRQREDSERIITGAHGDLPRPLAI